MTRALRVWWNQSSIKFASNSKDEKPGERVCRRELNLSTCRKSRSTKGPPTACCRGSSAVRDSSDADSSLSDHSQNHPGGPLKSRSFNNGGRVFFPFFPIELTIVSITTPQKVGPRKTLSQARMDH